MIRILAAACAVLALGLAICAWLLDEKGEALTASRDQVTQLQVDAALYDRAIQARDGVDHQFQEALGNVQADHDRLADGIRTGKYRVYVRAKCPVPHPGPAGSPDAGRAELDSADGQRVADLRAGIQRLEARVKGLQNFVSSVCMRDQVGVQQAR